MQAHHTGEQKPPLEKKLCEKNKSMEPLSRAFGSFYKAHIWFTRLLSCQRGYCGSFLELPKPHLKAGAESLNHLVCLQDHGVGSWESFPTHSSQQSHTVPEAALPFSPQTSFSPRTHTLLSTLNYLSATARWMHANRIKINDTTLPHMLHSFGSASLSSPILAEPLA